MPLDLTNAPFVSDTLDMKFEDESDGSDTGPPSPPPAPGETHTPSKNYKGIHITFPLKRADFDALIDTFRKKKVYQVLFCKTIN